MSNKKYIIKINNEKGMVVANFRGRVTVEDMFDFLDELYAHEKFDPNFPSVYDFTACSALGYQIDVSSFVEKLRKTVKNSKKKKVGVIIDNINQRFLIKTFIEKVKSLNLEVEMFNNKVECVSWITEDFEKRVVIQSMLRANSKSPHFQLNSQFVVKGIDD